MSSDNDIQIEAKNKINEVVDRLQRLLIEKVQNLSKDQILNERSLTVQESNLLNMLPKNQYTYNTLNGLLLSEIMLNEIFEDDDKAQKVVLNCYQNMTHLLQNFTLMSKVIQQRDKTLLCRAFSYSHEHLSSILNFLHSFPISLKNQSKKQTFVERHLNILQQAKQQKTDRTTTDDQQMQNKLKETQQQNEALLELNQQLRQSLSHVQNQLVQVELKFLNVLNQKSQVGGNNENQLKEQIVKLRMEIDRMNEQFKIQINKYNEVFRNLEAEINELRNYHNVDIIQELQTQIVRLREEIESDQIIIRELRERERERLKFRERQNNMGENNLRYYSPKISNASYSRYRNYY